MAELIQSPIQFPWQMVTEATAQKNKNFQDMLANIAGIGQGFGNIGQTIQNQNAMAALTKTLATMKGNDPLVNTIADMIRASPNQAAQLLPPLLKMREGGGMLGEAQIRGLESPNTENFIDAFRGPSTTQMVPPQANFSPATGGSAAVTPAGDPQGPVPKTIPGEVQITPEVMRLRAQALHERGIENRFGRNLGLRTATTWQGVATDYRNDPEVQAAAKARSDAQQVRTLILRGTPMSDAAISSLAPRALREVGNLTAMERRILQVSPALANRVQGLVQKLSTGTILTPSDRADLAEVMRISEKAAELKLGQIQDFYADQASINLGVSREMAKKRLGNLSLLGVGATSPVDDLSQFER